MEEEEFKKSIKNICKTYPYNSLPKPAHILDSAYGNKEERAWMALEILEKARRIYSADMTISFEDKTINRCIKTLCGNWCKFGRLEERDWNREKKNFIDLYEIFCDQDNREEEPLVGQFSKKNEIIVIECPYFNRFKNKEIESDE
ncbi:hypothetical protein [Flavobacterium sp.]|uniref:hypothetical protein n=1 Tax=Flavobacterium sp. TaxID=239 RepID=UPI003F6A17F8